MENGQHAGHHHSGSELERWLPDNTDGLPAKSSSPNSLLDGSDLFGPNTHVPSFTDELSDLDRFATESPERDGIANLDSVQDVGLHGMLHQPAGLPSGVVAHPFHTAAGARSDAGHSSHSLSNMGSLGPGSGMQASADSYGHTESAPTGSFYHPNNHFSSRLVVDDYSRTAQTWDKDHHGWQDEANLCAPLDATHTSTQLRNSCSGPLTGTFASTKPSNGVQTQAFAGSELCPAAFYRLYDSPPPFQLPCDFDDLALDRPQSRTGSVPAYPGFDRSLSAATQYHSPGGGIIHVRRPSVQPPPAPSLRPQHSLDGGFTAQGFTNLPSYWRQREQQQQEFPSHLLRQDNHQPTHYQQSLHHVNQHVNYDLDQPPQPRSQPQYQNMGSFPQPCTTVPSEHHPAAVTRESTTHNTAKQPAAARDSITHHNSSKSSPADPLGAVRGSLITTGAEDGWRYSSAQGSHTGSQLSVEYETPGPASAQRLRGGRARPKRYSSPEPHDSPSDDSYTPSHRRNAQPGSGSKQRREKSKRARGPGRRGAVTAVVHRATSSEPGDESEDAGQPEEIPVARVPRTKKRGSATVMGAPRVFAPNPHGLSCSQCGTQTTPVWRAGPSGPKTLCNACGVRHMKIAKKKHSAGTD